MAWFNIRVWKINTSQMLTGGAAFGAMQAYDPENHIPMRQTVRLDSNSINIYEGDVVDMEGWDRPAIVWYEEEDWMFYAGHQEGNMGVMLTQLHDGDVEIIGNIYENPEYNDLMKKVKK